MNPFPHSWNSLPLLWGIVFGEIPSDPIFSSPIQSKKRPMDFQNTEPATLNQMVKTTIPAILDQASLVALFPGLRGHTEVEVLTVWENGVKEEISAARAKFSWQNRIWEILEQTPAVNTSARLAKHRALEKVGNAPGELAPLLTSHRSSLREELKVRMENLSINMESVDSRRETFKYLEIGTRRNPEWAGKTMLAITDYIGLHTSTGRIEHHLSREEQRIFWEVKQIIGWAPVLTSRSLLQNGLPDHKIAFERIMQKMNVTKDPDLRELLSKMSQDRKSYLKTQPQKLQPKTPLRKDTIPAITDKNLQPSGWRKVMSWFR